MQNEMEERKSGDYKEDKDEFIELPVVADTQGEDRPNQLNTNAAFKKKVYERENAF